MNRTEHENEFGINQNTQKSGFDFDQIMEDREKAEEGYLRSNESPNEGEWRQRDSIFRQIRSSAATKLQTAAETLHQKADRSGQQAEISAMGHRAADWLERSADYVNEMEPQRMRSDLECHVRRNPGRSLLIAGIVGLALGGLLRRK